MPGPALLVAAAVALAVAAATAWARQPASATPAPPAPSAPPAAAPGAPPTAPASPAAPPAADTTPPTTGAIADADAFLVAQEKAGADLRTLSAAVSYIKSFPEIQGGGRHVRTGELLYDNGMERRGPAAMPARRLAARFDTLTVDGQRQPIDKAYVFDGAWLVERDEVGKQFIKVRVVAEGEINDPLRIGNGPFPLPIGQQRADILRTFDVELRPRLDGIPDEPATAGLRRLIDGSGATQVRLTPKAGTRESKDFREVRLWYRAPDLLPFFVRALATDESTSEFLLRDIQKNPDIPPARFDTATPPPEAGFQVDVREFRKQAEP